MPETVEPSVNNTESPKIIRYIHKTHDQNDDFAGIDRSLLTRRRPSLIPTFEGPEWELETSSKGKPTTEKHDGLTTGDLKPMLNMWQHQGFQSPKQSKKKMMQRRGSQP